MESDGLIDNTKYALFTVDMKLRSRENLVIGVEKSIKGHL